MVASHPSNQSKRTAHIHDQDKAARALGCLMLVVPLLLIAGVAGVWLLIR